MRATANYVLMKRGMKAIHLKIFSWSPKPGSGYGLGWRLLRLNAGAIGTMLTLAAVAAGLFYTPAIVLNLFLKYLQSDPERKDMGWGWVFAFALFATNAFMYIGAFLLGSVQPPPSDIGALQSPGSCGQFQQPPSKSACAPS
jgi:hypothetical protein